MAQSDISICSQAFLKIGMRPIQSFAERTREAEVAANLYQQVKDDMLGSYYWNFNTTRYDMSRDQNPPENTAWKYRFQRPTDCLVLTSVIDSSGRTIDYDTEGNWVYANHDQAIALYRRQIGEDQFPPFFSSVLIQACAVTFFRSVKGATGDIQVLMQELKDQIKKARSIDTQEKRVVQIITDRTSSLIRARFVDG